MSRLRPGGRAWGELALFIAVRDVWLVRNGELSMSEVFGNALKHPIKRWPVIAVWVVVTLHLFGELLPPFLRRRLAPFDPIGALARLIEPKRVSACYMQHSPDLGKGYFPHGRVNRFEG